MELPGKLVGTDWLEQNLRDPRLRILDCTVVMQADNDGYRFLSGRDEYDREHIPGSVFVDVLNDLADADNAVPMMMPPAAEVAELMADKGVGTGTGVVLYDRGNHAWAARTWWTLRACGFDNAAVLDGGWQKWRREGRPVSAQPGSYPRGDFTPDPRPELVADKEEVRAALERDDVTLIHALSPEEFRGETCRYSRPGRIPASENVFCQSLVDPDTGAYLPQDDLREKFAATRAPAAKRIITYCGGGIAASSDAFVLALLGYDNVAVYDGSLSEWTADGDLPMETG